MVAIAQAAHLVLRLPSNLVGRDFVIGDICGEFDSIYDAMRERQFNVQLDRIFHVGHLFGAGISSAACLRFLRHPSVYAIRSDGEQDLLDLFGEGDADDETLSALGVTFPDLAWLTATSSAERRQLIDAVRLLPIAISVGTRRAASGFVHAGVAGSPWEAALAAIDRGDDEAMCAALRGSEGEDVRNVSGVDRVFRCYAPGMEAGEGNFRPVLPGARLVTVEEYESSLNV